MFENAMLMYSVFMITLYKHVCSFRGPNGRLAMSTGPPSLNKDVTYLLSKLMDHKQINRTAINRRGGSKEVNIHSQLLGANKSTFEPPHDKTNNVAVRPAKTQISLGIHPSDQSLRRPREASLGP